MRLKCGKAENAPNEANAAKLSTLPLLPPVRLREGTVVEAVHCAHSLDLLDLFLAHHTGEDRGTNKIVREIIP